MAAKAANAIMMNLRNLDSFFMPSLMYLSLLRASSFVILTLILRQSRRILLFLGFSGFLGSGGFSMAFLVIIVLVTIVDEVSLWVVDWPAFEVDYWSEDKPS